MRGLPGSGKSYLAKQIKNTVVTTEKLWPIMVQIFSTDDYWIRPDGAYDWNFNLIKEAHKWNLSKVNEQLSLQKMAIVDNTNTTYKEILPYLKIANLHGNVKVILCQPQTAWAFDVDECFKRNTHRVPLETIKKMKTRFQPNEKIIKQAKKEFPELCVEIYNDKIHQEDEYSSSGRFPKLEWME